MRILVLGTQSFFDRGTKVGSQYLAEALARKGYSVDYVPSASSLFDIVLPPRRARFARAWWRRAKFVPVIDGLNEWSLRSVLPPHRMFVRSDALLEFSRQQLSPAFQGVDYDVCISDICPNLLLINSISAKIKICRLNDWPWGFESEIHRCMIIAIEALLRSPVFSEVWAVSQELLSYASQLRPSAITLYLPNGVDSAVGSDGKSQYAGQRRPNRAIYLGSPAQWFDAELVRDVAAKMRDWEFHVYGVGRRPWRGNPSNLLWLNAIARAEVAAALQASAVGLIPFRNSHGRMKFVERPLKFYEYVAAGLGVASTDVGALRIGMNGFAHFGNGVEGFSRAIELASADRLRLDDDQRKTFLAENRWELRTDQMVERVLNLQSTPATVR